MSETTGIEVKKYLNAAGVKTLWGQVDNYFARKTQIAELQDQINDLEQAGVLIDNETIIKDEIVGLKTNLILNLDKENNKLQLISAKEGAEAISEITLPSLTDTFLDNVSLVVIPDDEEATTSTPAGTYIKFTFDTKSGKEPIYLSTEELGIQVYEGSDYITINDGAISLNTTQLETWLGQTTTITSITTDIAGINSSIAELSGKISTLEDGLSALQTDYESAKANNFYHEALSDEDILGVIEAIENPTENPVE